MSKKLLSNKAIIQLSVFIILGLTFWAYLRTDFIFEITNTILTMCGW